ESLTYLLDRSLDRIVCPDTGHVPAVADLEHMQQLLLDLRVARLAHQTHIGRKITGTRPDRPIAVRRIEDPFDVVYSGNRLDDADEQDLPIGILRPQVRTVRVLVVGESPVATGYMRVVTTSPPAQGATSLRGVPRGLHDLHRFLGGLQLRRQQAVNPAVQRLFDDPLARLPGVRGQSNE